MSTTTETIEELSTETKEDIKERVKEIENGILNKINLYNDTIKDYDNKYSIFKEYESRGFLISQQLITAMKTGRNAAKIEAELNDVLAKVDLSRADTMESQKTALTTLQSLYKEHVDYLAQVIKGLTIRCEKLEGTHESSRSDNVFAS